MEATVPRDKAEVGLVVPVEGSGHANDDCVHLGNFGVVVGGVEADALRLLNGCGRNAYDVGPAGVEFFHFICRDVEACDPETFRTEEKRQRQPYVSHADNADPGFTGFDLLFQESQ